MEEKERCLLVARKLVAKHTTHAHKRKQPRPCTTCVPPALSPKADVAAPKGGNDMGATMFGV